MKILYGCCYKGEIDVSNYPDVEIDYVDIIPNLKKTNGKYICKDIRHVNFAEYDLIIVSPPCNYYSTMNRRRDESAYAVHTKDLLPYCINYCSLLHKPFIIENVRNYPLMDQLGLFNFKCLYFTYGRHTYWTNLMFRPISKQVREHITNLTRSKRQGGDNVNSVFSEFVNFVLDSIYDKVNNIYDTSYNQLALCN